MLISFSYFSNYLETSKKGKLRHIILIIIQSLIIFSSLFSDILPLISVFVHFIHSFTELVG